jgi:NADH-quinone oxidoreductase subunit C
MLYDQIRLQLQGRYQRAWDSHGMLVLDIARDELLAVVDALRSRFGFDLFLDVTAVDRLPREPRFDVVYHFLSVAQRRRIRLKLQLAADDLKLPTLTGAYGAARYMEREVHEMFGVVFEGNDDLRPILLYEGFEGHPLRKDYPLDGEQPIVPYRT